MSGYTQLTQGQRYQMDALLKAGHNQTMIATILSIHKSTLSRELQRHQGLQGYRPKQAHVTAMQRRNEKPKTHIPLTTWAMVNALIKQDWSPEQISGGCMKNKESRSAMNAFTSKPTKINAKEVIYTSTCVARNNGVNVMANKISPRVHPQSHQH
jgi:IS30 family transposase